MAACSWIGSLLERDLGGEAISECSMDTPEGVKVADVAWYSPEFLARRGYETPYRSAPEIRVQIRSAPIRKKRCALR